MDFTGHKTSSHCYVKGTTMFQKDLVTGEDLMKEKQSKILSSKISPVSRSISQRISEWMEMFE